MNARAWLRAHGAELALVGVGVALRLTMLRFDPIHGFDWGWHWVYSLWFAQHPGELPPPTLSPVVYHPPLYYWLVGALLRHGLTPQETNLPSVAFGIARLGVLWLGLVWFVRDRAARELALALAVVLPAGLHLDGCGSNEALSNLLCVGALVALGCFAGAPAARRWRLVPLLGGLVGLALLTKLSALVLVGAVGTLAAVELAWTRQLRRAPAWAAALALAAALASGFFLHNLRSYHKLVLSSAECGTDTWYRDEFRRLQEQPYLDRHTIGYVAGFDTDIFEKPLYPTGSKPNPRFFTILFASTFAEYQPYGFAREPRPGERAQVAVEGRSLRKRVLQLSRVSVAAGALVAAATLVAWWWAALAAWRRRALVELGFLLVPLFALAGQLHYAFVYPASTVPVKGIYFQFASAPLCALFGLAASSGRRARAARLLVAVAAVAAIGCYTFYCRLS